MLDRAGIEASGYPYNVVQRGSRRQTTKSNEIGIVFPKFNITLLLQPQRFTVSC
jgi:hypothetical protein